MEGPTPPSAPPPPAGAPAPTSGTGRSGGGGDEGRLPHLAVRFGQVFFAPGELFERLRERPAWIGAILLLVGLNLLAVLLMPQDLLRQMMEGQLPAGVDPAQAREQMDAMMRFGRISSLIGAFVMPLLATAVIAGVVIAIYNGILAGEASFRQVFSVTAHASFIYAVGGLLVLGLMIARGEPGAALSLHLLVPGLEEGYPRRLLQGLGFFGLWTSVVLAIGVTRLYPKRSPGGAAAVLLGLYVAFKALLAVFDLPGAS